MKSCRQKKLSFLFAALVAGITQANVLVYDGAPYVNKGETGGYSRNEDKIVVYQGLIGQTPTSEKIIGFDSSVGWNAYGSATVYILPSECALSLPQCFVNDGFLIGGAAAFGFLRNETAASVYDADRKLGESVRTSLTAMYSDENSSKLYFRVLMGYTADESYTSTSHKHAVVLNNKQLGSSNVGIGKAELGIGMSKKSGTVKGALWLSGTEYDLGTEVEPGKTYVGIVEVTLKGGEDGKARVRAFVVDGEDFPDTPNWYANLGGDGVDSVDVALSAPQYLAVMGSYGVSLKPVIFDEIALGTEYADVAHILIQGLECRKPTASDVTATGATVGGRFVFSSTFDAALSVVYGKDGAALDQETAIGTKNETGDYAAEISGLFPATTYYFQTKGTYGGETRVSEVISTMTLGVSTLGPVTMSGSKEDGVTSSMTIADIGYVGYANAKVELLFGTDSSELAVVKTWENQSTEGTFEHTVTEGVGYAVPYFAKFVVTLTVAEGETRTFETAIASYTTPADLVWKGAMGADWNTAANWNPSLVPFAGATVVFERGAKAVSSADSSVRTFKYDAKDEVAVDFGKKTLTLGALDFGENAAGTLVLSNGTFKLPNGAFNSGKGNTLVIGKGGTLDTDHKLNQAANAVDLVLDGGTFTSYGNTPTVGGLVKAINGGVFTMNTGGNGGETIGPNGSNGATVMAGEGGTVKFNYVTVGGDGSVNAQVVVSNGTATCNTGPEFGGTGSAIIVMADEGKTASFSTGGNIPGAQFIRVFDGTFSASSSQNLVIKGELEIARKRGLFKVTRDPSNGMTVNGKLIFDLPQGGYDAVPLQDAGRLSFGSNAKIQVDLANFKGVQKLITAKSITGLEASDFVFLNGKAKFCTVEITETDVTLTYKVPGLMMIVR